MGAKRLQEFDDVALSVVEKEVREDILAFNRDFYKGPKKTNPKRFPFKRWIRERISDYVILEEGDDEDPVIKRVNVGQKRKKPDSSPAQASQSEAIAPLSLEEREALRR